MRLPNNNCMRKFLFPLWIFTILLCIIGFFFSQGYLWFVSPDWGKYPIRGIDVSHYQGNIDWKKVSDSGIRFAYIKVTEWGDWMDDRFESNYVWARSAGVLIGAYHYYSLRIDPMKQFDHIIHTLSGKNLDLPLALDLEFWGNSSMRPDREEFQKWLHILLEHLEAYQWRKPVLYMTYEFREAYLGREFDTYPIWIRDIFAYPSIQSLALWQYKSRGHVSGIDGFVDLNTISGRLESLSQKHFQ